MAQVQRANVFLTIPDEDITKYLAKGYNVIDPKTGAVIRQSVPTELNALQKAWSEHEELIKQKDSEIAKLKEELDKLKTVEVKKSSTSTVDNKIEDDELDNWISTDTVVKKTKTKNKAKV